MFRFGLVTEPNCDVLFGTLSLSRTLRRDADAPKHAPHYWCDSGYWMSAALADCLLDVVSDSLLFSPNTMKHLFSQGLRKWFRDLSQPALISSAHLAGDTFSNNN